MYTEIQITEMIIIILQNKKIKNGFLFHYKNLKMFEYFQLISSCSSYKLNKKKKKRLR